MGLGLMAGAGGQGQHGVLAEGEWDVVQKFPCLISKSSGCSHCCSCQKWTSAQPTHLRLPRATGSWLLWQRKSVWATEIAEPLGLQKGLQFLCVNRESSGRAVWVGGPHSQEALRAFRGSSRPFGPPPSLLLLLPNPHPTQGKHGHRPQLLLASLREQVNKQREDKHQ